MSLSNVMIDIETAGGTPNAIILSIAAVKFNFGNDKEESFYVNVDMKSCKELGLVADPKTMQWWAEQPKEVRAALLKDTKPLDEALTSLMEFLGPNTKDMSMWANGITFDYPILEWACRVTDIEVPWKYWNIRDARTIYKVMDLDMREFPRVGQYHNALDDCRTQIAALKSVLV